MSSIGSIGSHPILPTPDVTPTGTTTGPSGTAAPVGSGVTAPVGGVPGLEDVTKLLTTSLLLVMMESLHAFMPAMTEEDADVLLAEVQLKMKEIINKTDNAEVTNKSEARDKQLEAQKKKLDDAEKKLQEQIKLEHSGDILDKIKLAFQILGAILATIVAAVVAVATFGAGTGVSALLMAGAVMGLIGAIAGDVLAVNDVVKAATGLGIAGNIDKLVHPNDPASWAKADMGFMFAVLGVAVVGMIAGLATGSGEEQIGTAVDKIEEVLMQGVLANVNNINRGIQAGTSVVQAGFEIGSGVTSYETTDVQAQNKKEQARAKEIEALLKHLNDMIDLAIKRLSANGDRWVKMLDSITEAIQDKTNHLSKAKLTA